MNKAVIFDLDGTLLNTSIDLMNAVNYALSSFGFSKLNLEQTKAYSGKGNVMLIKRSIGKEVSEDLFNSVFSAYKEYYFDNSTNKTYIYDGIIEVLSLLKLRGYKLAVVSNKMDFLTQKIIKHYYGDTFDFVTGGRDDMKLKPDPDLVYYAMKKLGVTKENTYYVGDSFGDFTTSINAQVKPIIVTYGFRDRITLEEKGATPLIDSPLDILKEIN